MVQANNTITTAEFSAKFKSKREIYLFLSVDCKAYLCACDNLTIYFLKGKLHRLSSVWRFFLNPHKYIRPTQEEKTLLQER